MHYYWEPNSHGKNKIKVELNSPNYATKSDLEKAADTHTSSIAKKADLFSLKSNFGKLAIGNLKTVPAGLSKIGNDKDILKNTVYDELVTKVNALEKRKLVSKTQ